MKLSVYLVLKISVCLAIPLSGTELPLEDFYERQPSSVQSDLTRTPPNGFAHVEADVPMGDNHNTEDVQLDPLSMTGNKFNDEVFSSSDSKKEGNVFQQSSSINHSEINVLPFLYSNDFRSSEATTLSNLDPVENVLRLIFGDDPVLEGSTVPLQSPYLANQNLSNRDDKINTWFSQHHVSGIKGEETKGHADYISGISFPNKGQSSNNSRHGSEATVSSLRLSESQSAPPPRHGSGATVPSLRLSGSQSAPPPRIIVHNYGERLKTVLKDHIEEGSLHQASEETHRTNNDSPKENLVPKSTESVQQSYHGSQMGAKPSLITSVMSRNEHVQLTSNPNDVREGFDPNAVNKQQQTFNPGQFVLDVAPQTGSDPNNAKYRISYDADEVNRVISQDRVTFPLQVPPGVSKEQSLTFDPNKLNSATFNFKPAQMFPQMNEEASGNFQTSFDPSKINSMTGGFQPNTVHINTQPKYNADEVNRTPLVSNHFYIPWSIENGKTDSNNQDQKGYTSVSHQEEQGENKESVVQGREHGTAYGSSQMQFGSFIPGRLYPGQNNQNTGQQKPAFLINAGRPAGDNGGTRLWDYERNPTRFDPNDVNAAQAAFDPDAMMRSLIGGHSNFKRDVLQSDNNGTYPSSSPSLASTTPYMTSVETTHHHNNANTSEINSVNEESITRLLAPSPTQDQMGFVPGQLAPGFSNYVFDPNTINQAAFQIGNSGGVDGSLGVDNIGGKGQNNFGMGVNAFAAGGNPGGVDGALGVNNIGGKGQVNFGMGATAFATGGNQLNASPFVHQEQVMNTNDTNENTNPYGNGFGMDGRFDPAAVNSQTLNFNYADMFGMSRGLGMQVDNTMDGGGFGGNGFDPNKVNRAFGGMESNSSTNGQNNMDLGSFGGNTEYGAFFDPSKVNTATFDADSLNNAQMNFDPISMLLNNPGITKDILKGATFDANKVNAVQMQFNPMNMLVNNPGMSKDVLGLISFDPNKINDQQNAFNPQTMFGNLFNTNNSSDSTNFANILFNPFGNTANLANEQNQGPTSNETPMRSENSTVPATNTQETSTTPTISVSLSMDTRPITTQEVTTVNNTTSS